MTWAYAANVLDLEPRGPLPTEIYWRRRGLAVGIAVVVIGIVAATVIAFMGHSSGAKPATAAVQPPPVLKEGDDCPDSTLAVKGLTNAPQYFIGDQPKFTMVVTNIGLVACKRDVGAAVLAAYVYSLDNKRLWSNLDCAPSNETLIKTFTPGEQVTTAVTWTGMGSAPHCPLPRPAIGPGTYNLVVQLGNLRSMPVPFIMNQPPPPPGPVPGPGQPGAVPQPEAPPMPPAG